MIIREHIERRIGVRANKGEARSAGEGKERRCLPCDSVVLQENDRLLRTLEGQLAVLRDVQLEPGLLDA